MSCQIVAIPVLASALSILNPAPTADPGGPQGKTLAGIEAALTGAGFESWDGIERDGETWQVDDAIHGNGHAYDVTIEAETYDILSRKRDD